MCKENRAMYASEIMNLPNDFLHKLNIYSFMCKLAFNQLVVKSYDERGKVMYKADKEAFEKYKAEYSKIKKPKHRKRIYNQDKLCARCKVGVRVHRSYCRECNYHYSKISSKASYLRRKNKNVNKAEAAGSNA
jgi:hypothetical protein